MSDLADWSQAVQVLGGSVSITGTATVQITGTPTVSISGTPSVNINNTPAVTISSGTVTATISGTPNINIQSQSVNIAVQQPQVLLGTFTVGPNTSAGVTNTFSVSTSCHAVGVVVTELIAGAALSRIVIKGHQTGTFYYQSIIPTQPFVIIPVMAVVDTSYDVTVGRSDSNAGNETVYVAQILDTLAAEVINPGDASIAVALTNSPSIVNNGDNGPLVVRFTAYDSTGVSAPAAASQASVVLAATPGKTYTAVHLAASSGNGGTAVQQAAAQLKDGTSLIYSMAVYLPGTTGANVSFNESGLAHKGTTGNSMTFQITAGTTGVSQTVNIGAYLR